MPKVRMQDGSVIDVAADALLTDDGNPFVTPPPAPPEGRFFTEEDVARIRQEEKDKLYSAMERNASELTALREQVGSLTEAQQQREAELQQEQQRLAAEAREKEEADLDAKTLLSRREQEWESRLNEMNSTWEQRLNQVEEQRQQAEAIAQREREFGDLRDYTLQTVEANKDKIAPQLLGWITGDTKEQVDAAVQRAIQTTDAIAEEIAALQQPEVPVTQQPFTVPQPPALPGTRATGGPANADPAAQFQQLTAEQIANMPMGEYAKLRQQMGIGGQSNTRGLFG